MNVRLEDYAARLRSDQAERELVSELRKLTEGERLQFVLNMISCGLPHTFVVGLWLAKTCLKDSRSLQAVLEQGLEQGDASTIKYWIDATVSGLGFRKTVHTVIAKAAFYPDAVVKAEYWLRQYPADKNNRDTVALAELQQLANKLVQDDPLLMDRIRPYRMR